MVKKIVPILVGALVATITEVAIVSDPKLPASMFWMVFDGIVVFVVAAAISGLIIHCPVSNHEIE